VVRSDLHSVCPLSTGIFLVLISVRVSHPQGHSATWRIMSVEEIQWPHRLSYPRPSGLCSKYVLVTLAVFCWTSPLVVELNLDQTIRKILVMCPSLRSHDDMFRPLHVAIFRWFPWHIKNRIYCSLQRIRWVELHIIGKVAVVYVKIAKKIKVKIKLN
jgi:hypothetical protein